MGVYMGVLRAEGTVERSSRTLTKRKGLNDAADVADVKHMMETHESASVSSAHKRANRMEYEFGEQLMSAGVQLQDEDIQMQAPLPGDDAEGDCYEGIKRDVLQEAHATAQMQLQAVHDKYTADEADRLNKTVGDVVQRSNKKYIK